MYVFTTSCPCMNVSTHVCILVSVCLLYLWWVKGLIMHVYSISKAWPVAVLLPYVGRVTSTLDCSFMASAGADLMGNRYICSLTHREHNSKKKSMNIVKVVRDGWNRAGFDLFQSLRLAMSAVMPEKLLNWEQSKLIRFFFFQLLEFLPPLNQCFYNVH